MKLTDTAKTDIKLPNFWEEGWIDEAIKELDKSNLTPEQRAQYEMIIAGNMTEVVAIENEVKEKAIINMLNSGTLKDDQIASFLEVSIEIVREVKKKITDK